MSASDDYQDGWHVGRDQALAEVAEWTDEQGLAEVAEWVLRQCDAPAGPVPRIEIVVRSVVTDESHEGVWRVSEMDDLPDEDLLEVLFEGYDELVNAKYARDRARVRFARVDGTGRKVSPWYRMVGEWGEFERCPDERPLPPGPTGGPTEGRKETAR